jgi:tight adherence protein C
MKFLIALLWSVSALSLLLAIAAFAGEARRPAPDAATRLLRGWVERYLLAREYPWIQTYLRHLEPMRVEVPLPPGMDLPLFLTVHLLCGVALWGIVAFALGSWNPLWAAVSMPVGMCIPYIWLVSRRKRMHTQLLRALPEALDLMALVMEAGLDLTAGIQHYAEKGSEGPLRSHFAVVLKDTQMGRSRLEALTAMARRTRFAPLREVTRGLVQGLSLGTSLVPFMREEASSLRVKRMQIAEKKAAEAPLKVLFPLLLFIFPTVFIVLFGPIMILFMQGGF